MTSGLEPEFEADFFLKLLNLLILEFDNLAACLTEKMVVMFGAECFFIVVACIGLPYLFDKTAILHYTACGSAFPPVPTAGALETIFKEE